VRGCRGTWLASIFGTDGNPPVAPQRDRAGIGRFRVGQAAGLAIFGAADHRHRVVIGKDNPACSGYNDRDRPGGPASPRSGMDVLLLGSPCQTPAVAMAHPPFDARPTSA